MATVIDALVVELGLDPSKFTKGQKEAMDSLRSMEGEARKRGKAIEESAKGVEQGFAAVQGRLLGVAGLLLGGLGVEQFIQRMTKLQVATANVAQVFGMSSQMMQQWAAAGERVGVSGNAVAQGMQALQQQRYNLQNFGDPSGILSLSWGTRGTSNPLNVQAPNGQMLPPEQMAMEIAKWLQKAGPQGANALMRMGGLSQDFVALLMKGPDKLRQLLEESKKIAPTDDEIARFKALNDAFEKTSQLAQRLGTVLTAMISPELVAAFEAVSKRITTTLKTLGLIHEGKYGDAIKNELGFNSPEYLKSREERLAAVERSLADAKKRGMQAGVDAFESERKQLIEEIRKLRETLQKDGGATVQKESMIGGFGAGGDNARLINASLTGGGIGGLMWGGGSQRGGGGRTQGGSYTPDDSIGKGLSGSAFLAARRGRFAEEMKKNPALRDQLAAMMALEGERDPVPVIESLMNRMDYAGGSLERGLGIGNPRSFYGPIRRGQLPGMIAALKRDPKRMARLQRAIDAALAGSHTIGGATDQGMRSDPNGRWPGGMVDRGHGNIFNDWGGGPGGHEGARRYREMIERGLGTDAASVPLPRSRPADLDKLERAGLDMRADARGGGSSAGDTNIGNVHIYPHKVDGDLASVIRPSVKRFARIASVNNGPA